MPSNAISRRLCAVPASDDVYVRDGSPIKIVVGEGEPNRMVVAWGKDVLPIASDRGLGPRIAHGRIVAGGAREGGPIRRPVAGRHNQEPAVRPSRSECWGACAMKEDLEIRHDIQRSIGTAEGDVIQALKKHIECFHHTSEQDSGFQEEVVDLPSREGLASKIVNVIVGSQKTRIGKKPSEDNMILLRERVCRFVERRLPIEARMVWGPKKHFALGDENAVDMSELLCLERLYNLHLQVQRLYSPGLHYNVFILDFEGEYVEGDDLEIKAAMNRYIETFEGLIEVLNLTGIVAPIRVNDVAKDETEKEQWRGQMREDFEKLRAYWYESEEKGIGGYEDYPSYQDLLKLRWKGCLPRETRDHYLKTVTRFLHEATEEEKVATVLKIFVASWLHHQFMILRTPHGLSPLNFSFVRPAPNIPKHLMKARVDLRAVSTNITKATIPPWTAKGFLTITDGQIKPAIKGWHDHMSSENRMVPGELILSGRCGSVRIRADFSPAAGSEVVPVAVGIGGGGRTVGQRSRHSA